MLRGFLSVLAVAAGLLGLSASPAFALTGTVSFSGYESRPAVPTGLTTKVTVPVDPADPAASQLRRMQLTLPQGFDLGPQMSTGDGKLQTCPVSAFAVHGAAPAACAADTKIGSVKFVVHENGNAEQLLGDVFLGAQPAVGELPPLYVEASLNGSPAADASRIKLVGAVGVDGDGRTSVTFDEIPRPPFSEVQLTLLGGDHALLGTSATCGNFAGLASFTALATNETAVAAGPVSIDQDCSLPSFAPAFIMGPDDSQAGAATTTTLAMVREDRSPRFGLSRLSLPNGLLANIGSVPECPFTEAAAAACGPDSQIGTIDVVAGLGPAPRQLSGAIYITPRPLGAVAGASIVVRAKVGDVDLGDFVMAARVDLRPDTAGLEITYTMPARFRGVALNLRSFRARLDRPGFMLNPASCAPLAYSSTLTSEHGQSVSSAGAVSYTGCESMPFAPTLSATLLGETGPLGHPQVRVSLNARGGDSTLKGAMVTLPRGIAADPDNLQNICPRAVFDAVACSASQRVGTATARVAVTPEPIPGDVYLIQTDGERLPGLGLSFTGRYAQRVASSVKVNSEQRLVVRFDTIPDLPLRSLDMDIAGGKYGPIRFSSAPCQPGSLWDAAFVGHGGQVASHTIAAPCAPTTAKKSAITLSSISGLTWRISDLGGRNLQTAKLTLPAGFVFVRSRARSRQYQVVKMTGATAKVTVTSRAVILTPRTKTTRSLSLKLKQGSVARTTKVAANSPLRRVKVKVRLGFTDGTVQNQTVTIRAR